MIDMTTKTNVSIRSLGRHLVFSAATAKAVCARMLEPHGLTLAQWAVLSSLWRSGEMGVKELAEMTGNEPPATSRIVDRMVAAGLLLRKPDPADRRAVLVGLTAKAKALRPLGNIYEAVNEVLLAGMTPEETARLFETLAKVDAAGRAWLGKAR